MKHKTSLVLAVLACLSAGAAFAAAQSGAASPPADQAARIGHAQLDANGDGSIDRGEAAKSPRLAAKFDALDKNKDGKLDAGERPQRGGKHHGSGDHLSKLDADKDGRISQAEAAGSPLAARFAEMDANKDGYVDAADRAQRHKQQREAWFAQADTDKDGKLSRAEYEAAKPAHAPMRRAGAAPAPRQK